MFWRIISNIKIMQQIPYLSQQKCSRVLKYLFGIKPKKGGESETVHTVHVYYIYPLKYFINSDLNTNQTPTLVWIMPCLCLRKSLTISIMSNWKNNKPKYHQLFNDNKNQGTFLLTVQSLKKYIYIWPKTSMCGEGMKKMV